MTLKKKRIRYICEPLFHELKKEICYLCHRRIKEKDRVKVGEDLYRHRKCNPVHFENLMKLHRKS